MRIHEIWLVDQRTIMCINGSITVRGDDSAEKLNNFIVNYYM